MTLFEKYGGMPTIKIIVRNFCMEIMSRPNLARYHEGMDLEGLITHAIGCIAYLLGNSIFSDEQSNKLRRHHHHLGITKHSYGKVAEILREELIAAKFEHADVEIVINIIFEHRNDIVTRR